MSSHSSKWHCTNDDFGVWKWCPAAVALLGILFYEKMTMHCPYCQHGELKVTDSREAPELNAVRRRRECLNCGERFTTFETVDLAIQVEKRDGRYEDFDQAKLVAGLEAACHRTRISRERVRALATEIGAELIRQGLRTVTSQQLGQMVMDHLEKLDSIAYIRFACVYRRFKDIDELVEAIQSIDEVPQEALR